jgi:NifB/MoaA-like Fe-S oxidoreductase
MSNEHYLEGVRSARAFYYSGHYGGLDQNIRAEDAIKLFLPPVEEALIQYTAPMPKPRKDWIKGFKEEQASILVELENGTGSGVPIT